MCRVTTPHRRPSSRAGWPVVASAVLVVASLSAVASSVSVARVRAGTAASSQSALATARLAAASVPGPRSSHAAIKYLPVHASGPLGRSVVIGGTAANGPVTGPGGEDLVNNGGPVLPTSTTYAIYWSPAAAAPGNATVPGADQSLINRFFGDIGGTPLYAVLSQYSTSSTAILDQSSFCLLYTSDAADE